MALAEVIHRGMAINPDARPSSARVMRGELAGASLGAIPALGVALRASRDYLEPLREEPPRGRAGRCIALLDDLGPAPDVAEDLRLV